MTRLLTNKRLWTAGAMLATAWTATAAQAQRSPADQQRLREVSALAETCNDPRLDLPIPQVIIPGRRAREYLEAMLRVNPQSCPGIAVEAARRLRAELGEPERGDVELELVKLVHRTIVSPRGVAPDPAFAERLARVIWLFDTMPDPLSMSDAERNAWVERPEIVALLEARLAQRYGWRAEELLGGLSLRRHLPMYNPARAATLFEQATSRPFTRDRLIRLLTDGEHMPPDFARAGRVLLRSYNYSSRLEEVQGELLRIGGLAAQTARTPAEQAAALHILWAASLDGLEGTVAARDALLRRLGRIESVPLAPGDAERISEAVVREYAIFGISAPEPPEPPHRPIELRGLVGPDGRIVMVEITQGSGSPLHDRAILGTWAEHGHKADLTATAQGRFVWTQLPTVAPRYAIEPR